MNREQPGHQTLSDRLAGRIRKNGPITFHEWMQAALYDERHGYYCRNDLQRWGRRGDYRTSPERTSLFAATFARYFVKLVEAPGSQLTVLEVGGGAGHFAAALLEALSVRFPDVYTAMNYILDEVSVSSRERAAERLARHQDRVQYQSLKEFNPISGGIVFSNELLDAFPVHRITRHEGELNEFYVGLTSEDRFEWRKGPLSTPRLLEYLNQFQIQLCEGQIVEINLELENWFQLVSRKLVRGYLITVDYGAEGRELRKSPARHEGTLRAYRAHEFAPDILSCPGEQDITTTVDWTAAKTFGEKFGFETVVFERLDRFLLEAGLLEELEERIRSMNDEAEKMRMRIGAREMILPGGMAGSFQVLVQRKSA